MAERDPRQLLLHIAPLGAPLETPTKRQNPVHFHRPGPRGTQVFIPTAKSIDVRCPPRHDRPPGQAPEDRRSLPLAKAGGSAIHDFACCHEAKSWMIRPPAFAKGRLRLSSGGPSGRPGGGSRRVESRDFGPLV